MSCGFVFTAATCMSKLQPAGRCEGEVPSSTWGPGPYPSLTPPHPASHWSGRPLGFGGSLIASSAFDVGLGGSSSIWLPRLWCGAFNCCSHCFYGCNDSIKLCNIHTSALFFSCPIEIMLLHCSSLTTLYHIGLCCVGCGSYCDRTTAIHIHD